MEKRGQNKQIEVMHVRNFQAQITRNKILTRSSNSCVSRQFDGVFIHFQERSNHTAISLKLYTVSKTNEMEENR